MSNLSWKRIVAATDFSELGNRAVACAHELAEKFGAELHVVHVAHDAEDAAGVHGIAGVVERGEESDEDAGWLKDILGETGTVRRIQVVEFGRDIAARISHYAEKNDIDLIVIASHGRSGIERIWLGSIAEQVLRAAPCPVLVLRPGKQEMDIGS